MDVISTSACFGAGKRWADYGIPCPSLEGFGYEIDAGLVRTPYDLSLIHI